MARKRKYAAYYRKKGTRKWKRHHPEIQGSKGSVVRIYQTWLLLAAPGHERQIRPLTRRK